MLRLYILYFCMETFTRGYKNILFLLPTEVILRKIFKLPTLYGCIIRNLYFYFFIGYKVHMCFIDNIIMYHIIQFPIWSAQEHT